MLVGNSVLLDTQLVNTASQLIVMNLLEVLNQLFNLLQLFHLLLNTTQLSLVTLLNLNKFLFHSQLQPQFHFHLLLQLQ